MNEARRVALQEYIRLVAQQMGVLGWDFHVTPQPPLEECVLMIETKPVVHYARVFVGTFFDDSGDYLGGPNEQRKAVVHEVVHVIQARMFGWLREGMLKDHMALATSELMANIFREEMEIQADRLADVIARYMPPVPEWPEE